MQYRLHRNLHRRFVLRGSLVGVIVALSAGVWLGAASARPQSSASANIYQGKDDCGSATVAGFTQIGTVQFTRTGRKVKLVFQITGAPPHTTYIASIWDNPSCDQDGAELGSIVTDGTGSGSATFRTKVKKSVHDFFATLRLHTVGGGYNDTTTVALP